MTERVIREMREWIEDCDFQDLDEVSTLTDDQVVNGVARHYDGGIRAFILECM